AHHRPGGTRVRRIIPYRGWKPDLLVSIRATDLRRRRTPADAAGDQRARVSDGRPASEIFRAFECQDGARGVGAYAGVSARAGNLFCGTAGSSGLATMSPYDFTA